MVGGPEQGLAGLGMPWRRDDEIEVAAADDADVERRTLDGHACRPAPSAGAGAHADRGDQAVPGGVALVFALATPEPVLVVAAGELPARGLTAHERADRSGRRLTALARLRALGRRPGRTDG